MKRIILFLALALSCKKSDPATDAAATGSSVERAIVPSGGCTTALSDEVAPCNGALGGKLDKYTWTVTKAGTWDVGVTQPKEIGGFRPVVIVWTEPDKTIAQMEGQMVGAATHVSTKLDPGAYRISIINGTKSSEPIPSAGLPYSLTITRAP
jgi:hypothetical protein